MRERIYYPDEGVKNFVEKYIKTKNKTLFINSLNKFSYNNKRFSNIVFFMLINKIYNINTFFINSNEKLNINGLIVGCFKYKNNRKNIIIKKYPFLINYLIYLFDFFYHRIISKLSFSSKFYFFLNKNRILSKAEVYGRLYACGFEIIDEKKIGDTNYFIFKKIKKPLINKEKNYGFVISLNRMGKNNKIFSAYKLRTMHPYSEYLQEYIYNKNKLLKGGKIKNDFRISPEGRFFRKYWLDELPMIINIIRGDIKLVGVRPLSEHYLGLYREDVKKIRSEIKPGFIPPFYADLPKTLEEIMESEKRYMELYLKNPIRTDMLYLMKSLRNVFLRGVRSQ